MHRELQPYNERMRNQIVVLEKLDHDIREFRIKDLKNEKLQAVMAAAGKIDFSYLFKSRAKQVVVHDINNNLEVLRSF